MKYQGFFKFLSCFLAGRSIGYCEVDYGFIRDSRKYLLLSENSEHVRGSCSFLRVWGLGWRGR